MENKTQKNEEGTEQLTVEESFARLDEMVKRLESEDVPLEESFRLYQEGMKLLKLCHEAIEEVEQKVQKIAEDGSLEDFE